MTRSLSWTEGRWTHEPAEVEQDGDDLVVTAREGSDAWRVTSYGLTHDSEHALLGPWLRDTAIEVSFTVALTEQFDQAGLFLRTSPTHWIKAGVEFADGVPQLGVVVTDPVSDWSAAPVPGWIGRTATIRASRSGDAVTVRARADDEPFRFVRLIPLDPAVDLAAGPYLCAPTRAGLTIRFHTWRQTAPDAALH
jgi:regulation of enolase protein 1 (concanavalin A-like superfamily)